MPPGFAGALLYALAGLVALASVLNFVGYREAQRSLAGMGILLAAAVVMPWLGSRKRRLATVTASAALKADAVESAVCGYMAGSRFPAWLGGERNLAQAVGRPRGRPGARSPDPTRGMAGDARAPTRMRLLLEP